MKDKQTYSDLFQIITESQGASELDKVAQEYKLLKAEIEEKTARLKELQETIKKLGVGKFETSNYMFILYERKGSTTLDKPVFEKLYPNIYADEKIWKTGKPSLVLDSVERKN